MEYSIKPILSLDRLIYTKSELIELGAIFIDGLQIAVLNGYRYYLSNYDIYIGLNEHELCLSTTTDITASRTNIGTYILTGDLLKSSKSSILQLKNNTLIPVLDPTKSRLRDIFELSISLISYKICNLMLNFMGCSDLINSFNNRGNLISIYPDNDKIYQAYGLNIVNELEIVSDEALNSINDNLVQALESYSFIETLVSSEDLLSLKSDYLELTNEGDISDYISLKTLVDTKLIQVSVPSSSEIDRLNNRIKRNRIDITIGSNWDSNNNLLDPYLYYFSSKTYEIITRKVNEGDLLELVIMYKESGDVRQNITYETSSVQCEDIPKGTDDPFIYWTNHTNLKKLVRTTTEGTSDITYNGYHITYGNIGENSIVVRFQVIDSFILIENKFYIQINLDTINLFIMSPDISEYYIKSCKLITT